MRVLVLHNRYKWPGGEDRTFADEVGLLREHGHEVVEHVADNKEILARGKLATMRALWRAAWSRESYERVRDIAGKIKPDIVHVHNFWYALSPSVLSACHDAGFPVVLRLPNFRLLCPGGVFLNRDGRPCQDCVETGPALGVERRCYHDSWLASKAVARMIEHNRKRGTWEKDVDLFLVPSNFCKSVFVRGGFQADKLVVKPNFVRDPYGQAAGGRPQASGSAEALQPPASGLGPRVLFIGRLSREKGLKTLLTAWKEVQAEIPEAELRIVGDGPMREELQSLSEGLNVSFAGRIEGDQLYREIEAARFTVLPSECYETFGRVVIESYACGRPVMVSNIGGPAELVRAGETGVLFTPGNAEALAAKVLELLRDSDVLAQMGRKARDEYGAIYTPEANYHLLMDCYGQAAESHRECLRSGGQSLA